MLVWYLATAAVGLFGEGSTTASEWHEVARQRLLADGWPGLLDQIGEQTPVEDRTAAGQAAPDEAVAYFAKHTERLQYFGRLRAGQSIGSG